MNDPTPDLATSTPCGHCTAQVPLESEACPKCTTPAPFRLGYHEFFAALERRQIMDARFGGLVLGREGPEDDIPMLHHRGAGVFQIVGAMQGGEYILSAEAAKLHGPRLHEINSENGTPPRFAHSPRSVVIDTNLMPPGGALWVAYRPQFVINRFATEKYFAELEQLNISSALIADSDDGV